MDLQWDTFIADYYGIFNECFPVKQVPSNKNRNGLQNQGVIECKNRLDVLLMLKRQNPQYCD